jgi:hypothetical protein
MGGGIVGGYISYRDQTERKEYDKLVRELPAVFGRIMKAVSNLDRQFLQISASVDDITRLSLGGKAPKTAAPGRLWTFVALNLCVQLL